MSADLVVQKAIRARLVATAAVTGLVPANSIIDRNERPVPNPSIIIGESQLVDEGDIARTQSRVFATLHIWKKDTGLAESKKIAGAIRTAIHAGRAVLDPGFHLIDWRVSGTRFMRDPDGEHSHGVVTVNALVREVAT